MGRKPKVQVEEVEEIDFSKQVEDLDGLLEKEYGADAFLLGSDLQEHTSSLSTGSLSLDLILKRPLPVGIHEISGPYGSGKTTIALHACANAQKKGWPTYYVNFERALNDSILSCIKDLDQDKLKILNPTTGEQATNMILKIFGMIKNAVVVLDSVTSCYATEAIIAKDMAEQDMGTLGRLMSKFLAKVNPIVWDSAGRLILINQIRDSLSPYATKTTPGGKGIEHYTNSRIWLKGGNSKGCRIEHPESKEFIGKTVEVEIGKTRFCPPGMQCTMPILFGKGIWNNLEILNLGVEYSIIEKAGSWYTYKTERVGQGEMNCLQWLEENPSKLKEIKDKIFEMNNIKEDGI